VETGPVTDTSPRRSLKIESFADRVPRNREHGSFHRDKEWPDVDLPPRLASRRDLEGCGAMLDGDARARVGDGSQPGAGSRAEHEFRALGKAKLDRVGAGLAKVAAVHDDPAFDFVAEVCLRRGMP
jgi:hypothetical protein